MCSLLIDATEATLEISAAEIRTIRKQDDRLAAVLPALVTAVVVPSDCGFGMARMWEILTERPGWSARAFRSRPEAEVWLRDEVRRKFALESPPEFGFALVVVVAAVDPTLAHTTRNAWTTHQRGDCRLTSLVEAA
ncbi:MAG TPA: hypothetical protein VIX14_14890 [Terriglobales bacterium]